MRPTIVLMSPLGDHHRELEARLRSVGDYVGGDVLDRLEWNTCTFGVDLSGDVLAEFDEQELAEIGDKLGEFSAVLLEYRDVPCVRGLLREILPGLVGLIDTNFGEILEYGRVLERFEHEPDWDWRDVAR
ncbi:hypothetical protein [Streptomyces alboflavus]|uniref:hypothetical protein n=1 Tax=Streptomyces alboflavus TaxID=67267 RepID=UPI0004C14C3E|nr:hypothetical protein [Streptomyces alboflavus]